MKRLRRARAAIATIFFVNGFVLASWVPHIPAVKHRHALGDGELGLVLVSMAVGALIALPFAGRLVDRFGSRTMTAVAAVLFCLALPLPVLSPSLATLAATLALFGAANAALDVSMNAQAVGIEQGYGRAILSSFHGLFSLGGMSGAAIAAGAMRLGVSDFGHVVATTAICTAVVASLLPWLTPSVQPTGERGGFLLWPTGTLFALGCLALCGLLAEGAMADWSAVYLHDSVGADPALAAAGFAAFSLTMAAGRFGGDAWVQRFGAVAVLRLSSALAATGLALALLFGGPAAGVLGCAGVGLGIANIIPILFGAAARESAGAGSGLSAVAVAGYCGFLAGPPIIGGVAEITGLRPALGLVSLACGLVALRSRIVARETAVAA